MAIELLILERIKNGLTFEKYSEISEAENNRLANADLTDEEKSTFENIKLNQARTKRILKTFVPSESVLSLANSIKKNQIWMILTENWCGDSAQIIPIIHLITKNNEHLQVRIIERDKNLDIMDLYLTNGSRSIPKIVIFDEYGNELLQWGARPKEAQELINGLKSQGIEKNILIEKLHLWYAQNKGQALQAEFAEILKSMS